MSTSLRDQLLQAGLVSKKQVEDTERRQLHQQRQPPPKHPSGAKPGHDAARPRPAGKAARDQELNRQVQARAAKKALAAQIKQLIDQNPLPTIENGEPYHFLDGAKIRQVMVDADARRGLVSGHIVVVRNEGRYHLVAASVGARVRERDADAVIAQVGADSTPDPAYAEFPVPDDLLW